MTSTAPFNLHKTAFLLLACCVSFLFFKTLLDYCNYYAHFQIPFTHRQMAPLQTVAETLAHSNQSVSSDLRPRHQRQKVSLHFCLCSNFGRINWSGIWINLLLHPSVRGIFCVAVEQSAGNFHPNWPAFALCLSSIRDAGCRANLHHDLHLSPSTFGICRCLSTPSIRWCKGIQMRCAFLDLPICFALFHTMSYTI